MSLRTLPSSPALSATAAEIRRYDPDRYLACLFAPPAEREALFALLAFNLEIAKTRESVSEPMLGQIRLQWWREAIDGIYTGQPLRRHFVVEPLAAAVRRFGITRLHLDAMIDGREFDLGDDPPPTLRALESYTEATASRMLYAGLEVLGVEAAAAFDAAREIGIGWALTGLVRAIPFHARAKRLYIPADLAAAADLHTGELFELRPTPPLRAVVGQMTAAARAHLAAARAVRREVPRAALPVLLPARLADGYLARIARAGNDVFSPPVQQPDPLASLKLALAALRRRY